MTTRRTRSAKILTDAIEKTHHVQEELQHAVESLSDANSVLAGPMSTAEAASAIVGAVKQNIEAETKVHDATQELENVKELLHEAQVAQASGGDAGHSGEGTASILGYFEGRRAQVREDEAKRNAKS